ncbi:MAG TPA: presqualene diphosphate synthase HpnD [Nitrospinota bacterium]|nr:presqualene diphosphate synthase HpnD [Nitrospinota bacterium]
MQSVATRSLEYCRKLTRRSRSNFFYSFLFLPRPRREAIYAVYAFSRAVDDVVDEKAGPAEAAEGLAEWRREVDRMYGGRGGGGGRPDHPIAVQMAETVRAFNIPRQLPLALIAGCEMDLDRSRYETFEDLYRYCYHVASVIGLMCIEVFGYRTENAKRYAEKLGVAFQLTNILRDVRSDAERRRIYLPREDLDRFGCREGEILGGVYGDRFIALMKFQCERAHRFYEEARETLVPEDRPGMLAAEIMGGIYRRLLREIENLRYDVFRNTVSLSRLQKMWIALRVWAAR